MIALTAICRNEIDIVDQWVQHHLCEGVDRIFVADASDDGTREVLQSYDQVEVSEDTNQYCLQVQWMNILTEIAGAAGADWIIASDVDEFWYAVNGELIAKVLADCPYEKLYAQSYLQYDDARVVEHKRLPKVCFRYSPGLSLAMGNHEVSIAGGEFGILNIRELQFRSYEHYVQKVRDRIATLDPAAEARGDGAHYAWLKNKGAEELRQQWEALISVPMIADPIPSHHNIGSRRRGEAQ